MVVGLLFASFEVPVMWTCRVYLRVVSCSGFRIGWMEPEGASTPTDTGTCRLGQLVQCGTNDLAFDMRCDRLTVKRELYIDVSLAS